MSRVGVKWEGKDEFRAVMYKLRNDTETNYVNIEKWLRFRFRISDKKLQEDGSKDIEQSTNCEAGQQWLDGNKTQEQPKHVRMYNCTYL